jgi:hypothetical protein
MESLKKSGRGIWALKDKAKIKRKKAPAPRATVSAAPKQQERAPQIQPYDRVYERPADKSREELRSRLDYFASIFKEEREHKTFEPSRELQNEMNALRSTLENTIGQLERVGEYLVREVQVVKQESAESPLDDKELISGVGDIGALFAQQVDKVRSTIKSTLGLPVLRPGLLTAYIELLVKSI